MNLKQRSEKLVKHISWDQQSLNYILVGGLFCSMGYLLTGFDTDDIVNLGYHGAMAYYVIQSYTDLSKYYRGQIYGLVSKSSNHKSKASLIQREMLPLKKQSRQISIYYQMLLLAILLDLCAKFLITMLNDQISIYTSIILTTSASCCLVLFTYLSTQNYVEIYGESEDSSFLSPQIYVIKGAIFILGLVFWKYTSTKTDSVILSTFILFQFFVQSMNSIMSISRFGSTSTKSFANFVIGCLFRYLSEALRQIVLVQNKPIEEIKMLSSMLSFLSWYMLITGVFLHIKAFTDCKLIELSVICDQIEETSNDKVETD